MLTPAVSAAQSFGEGDAAYKRGDYVQALKEWRPLAEDGFDLAQFNLGYMYERGEGVPQDYSEAFQWYRRAAEQGDAGAQFNVALMYGKGEGVPQDYVMSHMWANIAGAKGVEKAITLRDALERLLSTDDLSEAQRRARVCIKSEYQKCD